MTISALDKTKVLLGLSGGVDSTAAALLLQNKGFKVTGLYFDVHQEKGPGADLAEKSATQLGIDYVYRNVYQDFSDTVIANFCSEYLEGKTPNPCVLCNPTIKFKTLLEEADKIGAYYIGTGHYARVHFNENNRCFYVRQAENTKKDQSYMLYRLGQEVLSRLLLPLDGISDKEETRNLVRAVSMTNAEQKDSQEICFLANEENYIDYIDNKGFHSKQGDFIDENGNVLGKHQGLIHYTIGQRKGLGITFGKPVYVTRVNSNDNTVTLGSDEDLFKNKVISMDNTFVVPEGETWQMYDGLKISAKIRYASSPAEATLKILEDGLIETEFMALQRAVTPGQSIVFYQEDLVIGGGIIK